MHKKYIKRDGRVFGPYYYSTYRENGKIKTRYLGSADDIDSAGRKLTQKKSFSFDHFLVFIALLSLLIAIPLIGNALTGHSVEGNDAESGDSLSLIPDSQDSNPPAIEEMPEIIPDDSGSGGSSSEEQIEIEDMPSILEDNLTIQDDFELPSISFTYPTPSNGSAIIFPSQMINVSSNENLSYCNLSFDLGFEKIIANSFININWEDSSVIRQTRDGNYIIGSSIYKSGSYYGFAAKLDREGNQIWNVSFEPYTGVIYGIEEMNDGKFIAVGGAGGGLSGVFLYRLNATGGIELNRSYGGRLGADVMQTTDGGYIIGGIYATGGWSTNDVWVIKTNYSGDVEWNVTYGGGTMSDWAYSIKQTSDGGYIVSGVKWDGGSDKRWLLKLNSTGGKTGERIFSGWGSYGYGVIQTSDGGYLAAGISGGSLWLVKTNYSLNTEWDFYYDRPYGAEYALEARETSDGGYVAAGWQYNSDGYRDILLIKVNSTGSMLWNVTYGTTGVHEGAFTLDDTEDGGFAVGGFKYNASTGIYMGYYLKVNSTGGINGQYSMNLRNNDEFTSADYNVTNIGIGHHHYYVRCADTSNNTNTTELRILDRIEHTPNVSRCMNLTQANNVYTMNQSINAYGADCIKLLDNNITLDCQGFNITNGSQAITVYKNSATIKNCFIYSSSIPFKIYGVDHIIANSTAITGSYGTVDQGEGGNTWINVTISNMSNAGLDIGTSNNIFGDCDISGTNGIRFFNNNLVNNTIINSKASGSLWAISNTLFIGRNATTKGINVSVGNLNLTFESLGIDLVNESAPAPDPSGKRNISKYVNITNTTSYSWILLNISYQDANLSGIEEDSLRLYKYNGVEWILANTTSSLNGVDTTRKVVYANITEFSVFGILGDEEEEEDTTPPLISIVYPLNTTYTINVSSLNYTVSDANLQACWYSTDNGQTNTSVACGINLTGLTSNEGSNTWLVGANDTAGNSNFSRVTFFKDTIPLLIDFVNPTPANGSTTKFSTATINVTVSENVSYCLLGWRSFSEITNITENLRNIDIIHDIENNLDGGYIATGYTKSDSGYKSDAVLWKVNSAGETEWISTLGGAWYDEEGYAVKPVSDGYAIAGYMENDAYEKEFWLAKTDFDGNLEWSSSFGVEGYNIKAYDLETTSDGGYILVGEGYLSRIPIAKFNSDGSLAWNMTYESGEYGKYYRKASDIEPTSDGGYLITGDASRIEPDGRNIFMIKINSSGYAEWRKIHDRGPGSYDWSSEADEDYDGGFIIAGYTGTTGPYNIISIKTNSSGDLVWNKTYGEGYSSSKGHSVKITPDNKYILAGEAGSDAWIAKINESGSTIWNTTFNARAGWDDVPYKIIITSDEEYVFGGYIHRYFYYGSRYDMFIAKLDSDGNPASITSTSFREMSYSNNNNATTANYTISNISIGNHSFYVKCTDTFGNTNTTETRFLEKIQDIISPSISFAYPTPEDYANITSSSQMINVSSNENLSYCNLSVSSKGSFEKIVGDSFVNMYVWEDSSVIRQTRDGNYIIGSSIYNELGGSYYGFAAKLDREGNQIWNVSFEPYTGVIYGIEEMNDGKFIVTGGAEDGSSEVFLYRLNATGGIELNRSYGGRLGADVMQTTDGGYVIAGSTSSISGVTGWVIKTNYSGDVEWNVTYSEDYNNWFYSIKQTSDGGYIVSGVTNTGYTDDRLMLKLNSTGEKEWERIFTENEGSYGYGIINTSDGGYLAAGIYGYDLWLAKTNSSGETEWNFYYGDGYGYGNAYALEARETSDGGYVAAGWQYTPDGDRDILLIKVNSTGSMLWNLTYGTTSIDEGAYTLDDTEDGGFAVGGFKYNASTGIYMGYYLKVNSEGRLYDTYEMNINNNDEFTSADYNVTNISYGFRYYYATCADLFSNTNTTETRGLTRISEAEDTNISECMNLTQANTLYTMNKSINAYGENCINIMNTNITLDCRGFNIINSSWAITSYNNSATIKNCFIYSSDVPFKISSSNNLIVNSTALTGIYGTVDQDGGGNTWINVTISNMSNAGMEIWTSNNIIKECNISGTRGIRFFGYNSTNSTIIDSKVSGSAWAITAFLESNATTKGIDVSVGNLNLTFESLGIDLVNESAPAPDPSGKRNISKYLRIEKSVTEGWILLNISYQDANLSGIEEDSLRLYKYNGVEWILANTTSSLNGVDTTRKVVYANITEFSVFGILGDEEDITHPSISFVNPTPENGSINTAGYATINVTVSENVSLCMLVWNNTNHTMSMYNNDNLTTANKTITFVGEGNYSYYVWCNDTAGNSNVTETRLLIYYSSAPAGNLECFVNNETICPANYTELLRLMNTSGGYYNAHAQLVNATSYPSANLYNNTLCCKASFNLTNQSGTPFLNLANYTNSHVQNPLNNTYTYPAWIGISDTLGYDIGMDCRLSELSCPTNYTCLLSLSGQTNAHVADCSYYNTKACCIIAEDFVPYIFQQSPAENAFVNNTMISFICNATDDSGLANISIEIWNSTSIFYSNSIAVSGTYNTTNWTVAGFTETSYNWSCKAHDNKSQSINSGNRTITVDLTAPIITIVNPAQYSQLSAGTTQTEINITTNETAECRYNLTSDFSFESGIPFLLTNSTEHTFTRTGLSNGINYTQYYRCRDLAGNEANITHSFSVAAAAEPPGGGGGGGQPPCTPSWSCGAWSSCVGGSQSRTCNDGCGNTKTETQSCTCTEIWSCTAWSPSECPPSGIQTRTCTDLNDCGTTVNKPAESKSCTYIAPPEEVRIPPNAGGPGGAECFALWNCTEWGACGVSYTIDDIIKGNLAASTRERKCIDLKNCLLPRVEKEPCFGEIDVDVSRETYCYENYITVIDKATGRQVSRLKETKDGRFEINVGIVRDKECWFCKDGLKNYDEVYIDCGGSCPACNLDNYFEWLVGKELSLTLYNGTTVYFTIKDFENFSVTNIENKLNLRVPANPNIEINNEESRYIDVDGDLRKDIVISVKSIAENKIEAGAKKVNLRPAMPFLDWMKLLILLLLLILIVMIIIEIIILRRRIEERKLKHPRIEEYLRFPELISKRFPVGPEIVGDNESLNIKRGKERGILGKAIDGISKIFSNIVEPRKEKIKRIDERKKLFAEEEIKEAERRRQFTEYQRRADDLRKSVEDIDKKIKMLSSLKPESSTIKIQQLEKIRKDVLDELRKHEEAGKEHSIKPNYQLEKKLDKTKKDIEYLNKLGKRK